LQGGLALALISGTESPQAKSGRHPRFSPGLVGKGPKRFSAQRKVEIVLRLLRGEDLELLSRELGVNAAWLSKWRAQFLTAGQAVLKKRPQAPRDLEIARLQQKLGEVTMDNELLQKKIEHLEDGRPLARRRSRR
jgi:transposase